MNLKGDIAVAIMITVVTNIVGIFTIPLYLEWLIYSDVNVQFNVGCYFSTIINSVRSKTSVLLHAGSWYRQGDSFIVLGGFSIQQLKIGASFDLNSDSFTENIVFSQSDPSYEISLTYIITRSKKVRRVSNPIF